MDNKENKWDKRFLRIAQNEVANWSKDESSKVAAIIMAQDGTPRSFGFNGFPRNVRDDIPKRLERPLKYKFTQHAEQNALNNCAKAGIATDKCYIYVTHFPCASCSGEIINCGIEKVFVDKKHMTTKFMERWKEDIEVAKIMFLESGVELVIINLEEEDNP